MSISNTIAQFGQLVDCSSSTTMDGETINYKELIKSDWRINPFLYMGTELELEELRRREQRAYAKACVRRDAEYVTILDGCCLIKKEAYEAREKREAAKKAEQDRQAF